MQRYIHRQSCSAISCSNSLIRMLSFEFSRTEAASWAYSSIRPLDTFIILQAYICIMKRCLYIFSPSAGIFSCTLDR